MSLRDRVQALLTRREAATPEAPSFFDIPVAEGHCDGPCGVYDPASARVAAEAVLSMSKKMLDLHVPDGSDDAAWAGYLNTMSRFAAIKEEEAQKAKHEILVLWTDYFKPEHLERFPDLHATFWNAAKACSACKQNVDVEGAQGLLDAVKSIHEMFWASKDRDVPWVQAVP